MRATKTSPSIANRVCRGARRVLPAAMLALGLLSNAGSAAALPPPEDPNAPPKPAPKAPPTYVEAPEGFHWWLPSRAEGWVKAWRPQTWPQAGSWPKVQAYDPEYVNPKSWSVNVQGCVNKADFDRMTANQPTLNTYSWTANGTTKSERRCKTTLDFAAQGTYPVSLKVTNAAGATVLSKTRNVTIRDILIVAMGDSMSSGEGSPDEQRLDGTPGRQAEWVDRQCHRSKSAAAAQAAKYLESATTSVTFLSFACSGATLDKEWALGSAVFDTYEQNPAGNSGGTGVLGPYAGIEAPPGYGTISLEDYNRKVGGLNVPSQVTQLKRAVGTRKVDAIVMSAGLNDAGFSKMMFTCALYSNCPDEKVGFQPNTMPLKQRFAEDVKSIPAAYERFGNEIRGIAKRVLVLEYPNAFTGDNGQTCEDVLEDVISVLPGPLALSMTKFESNWAQTYAEPLLHNSIREGARRAGFEFVSGPWAAFKGHGYCASDNQRWLRRATESAAYQGPYMNKNTTGTIHPNFSGYYELSKFIVNALRPERGSNNPPVATADKYTGAADKPLVVGFANGLLANDKDADLIANLRVANHTKPSGGAGTVLVAPDGSFTFTPKAGFTGTTSFLYTVTDGFHESTTRAEIFIPGPPVLIRNFAVR
jgi:PKD repeat protein